MEIMILELLAEEKLEPSDLVIKTLTVVQLLSNLTNF